MGPAKAQLLWDKEDWKNSLVFCPCGGKATNVFPIRRARYCLSAGQVSALHFDEAPWGASSRNAPAL